MKNKVLFNASKGKAENRKQQAEDFKQRYNKLKVFEFPPINKINMVQHFYFPKGFTSLGGLTKAAISVYPVLCSIADYETNNWFQSSRENIAKMAGINPLTVDKGIEYLMTCTIGEDKDKLLQRQLKTEGKRHFYMYQVGFIRKDMIENHKGQFFIFHNCIIKSGIWAKLSPRAQALYLAIRSIAKFDWEGYALEHDIEYTEMGEFYGEDFKNRKWDYCLSSMTELCRMVNIESSNIKEVLQQLEYYRLVEKESQYFKVFLKPKIRGIIDNDG